MNTTPNYKKWFTPAGEVVAPLSLSEAPFQAGAVIAQGSGNRNQNPPTSAMSDDVIFDIVVPFAENEKGEPVSIKARIDATFSVEDWGYVTVDGERIIDMTRAKETAGRFGGHATWPAQTRSAEVSSGSHRLVFHYENISMADASNNKIVCEYSYRVVALEAGGVKEPDTCGCGGSTCSIEGGLPAARSGSAVVSSSAGSEVSASVTADSLYWSCNAGALRGFGAMLGGKLVMQAKALSAALASPAALLFNHPLAAILQVPAEGAQPGCRLEIHRGNRVIALRYYSDGSISPVGVDSAGLGVASLLPAVEADEVPPSLRWQDDSGAAWRFSLLDGSLMSYTSPDGVLISDVSDYFSVKYADGALRQVWSYWDGLVNVEDVAETGFSLALYPPDLVAGPDADSGLFSLVEGAAYFRKFTFTWESGTLAVTESAPQRQDVRTAWQQSESGAWSMTRGTGAEAVTTTQTRTVLEPASAATGALEVWQLVTEMRQGDSVASCICEVYQSTPVGELLLSHVEDYGSPTARTTLFEYDGCGNEIRRTAPDGAVAENCYDQHGRLVKSYEPWRGGDYTLITDYSYVNSSASQFNGDIAQITRKLRPADGGLMTTLSTETHTYSQSGGVKREEIRTTATGSTNTHLEISETWTGEAAVALNRGRIRMHQEVDGVQQWYDYAPSSLHGAIYTITEESRVAGNAVPGQSRRRVSFINAAGNTVREEEYAFLSDGETWALLSGVNHSFDAQNQPVGSVQDNGRASSREVNCSGSPIWELDADGVRTDYTYDSARRLTEVSRAEVRDGETVITPETITEYVYDAKGRTVSTITHTGAMQTARHTAYDGSGRVISSTDELGRVTTTAYSADGLTTNVTTPAGATTITQQNPDGSTASISGTAQRETLYSYSVQNGFICETQQLADGTIIAQTTTNGFGQVVVQAQPNTQGGFICSRSEYNAKGQLVKTWADTGLDTTPTAATLYEYDAMGNVVKQTLALAEQPSPENSPITETSFGAESLEDGVYSITTTTRYNAAGQPLTSVQKQLISQLSPTLESKSVFVSERSLTSTQWSEYSAGTKRVQYSTVPTSSITAETVTVDGVVRSQKDTAGITTTATRSYTANGMVLTQTDGRGNTTTTVTDKAGRALMVTDAAGNVTTTVYCDCCDQPATITDAQGNTTCYRYDIRGRKVAEWGTGILPATFGYDDAGNMVTLTTFRNPDAVISSDPAEWEGLVQDTTTWTFDSATGLELSKTYADNTAVVKTYDAHNRLATKTNARGKVKVHSYEHARGLLLNTTWYHPAAEGEEAVADSYSPSRSFTYNHLGQLTQVTDDAGVRSIGYNQYGEQETDSLVVDNDTHLITETRDAQGRSTGYVYSKNGTTQQTVCTGYGNDGRIATAGFLHGGVERQFTYAYLPGTNLLQTLTKPNNMTLTQSYEPQRNLLTGMCYKRSATTVAERTYTYDALGRPLTRTTSRGVQSVTDSFGYNNRSELTTATVNGGSYAYDYDNIGNRLSSQSSAGAEADAAITEYTANQLNQYTALTVDGDVDFQPEYDADGNQCRVKTSTGIWAISYDAENRPTDFTSQAADGTITSVHCEYDYMGRRTTKMVTVGNNVTLQQRYIYRGYLQIACIDLTRSHHPALWFITWDPTQPVATRPLAIQKDGSWFTYGWDLTKNICELYGPAGYIRTAYNYTPYGEVTAEGDVTQPIQWSSEYNDDELGLIYYNYRHYNPVDGVWFGRDPSNIKVPYTFAQNNPINAYDYIGLSTKIKFLSEPEFVKSNNIHKDAGQFEFRYKSEYSVCAKRGNLCTVKKEPKYVAGFITIFLSNFNGRYSKIYNSDMNAKIIETINLVRKGKLKRYDQIKKNDIFADFYTLDGVYVHEMIHFKQAISRKEEVISKFPDSIGGNVLMNCQQANMIKSKNDMTWEKVPSDIIASSFTKPSEEVEAYTKEWLYYGKEHDKHNLLL